MNFYHKYAVEFEEYDAMAKDFIDDDKIWDQLNKAANPSKAAVRKVLAKAERKVRLDRRRWRSSFRTKTRRRLMTCTRWPIK